jgi:hypothetical protein
LPTGAQGEPDTVHQPALATYSSRYFRPNDTGDGVVFTAPVDAVTTGHSHYARSELREMNGPDEPAWSNTTGVHTLTVTEAVTHLPDAKPEAVAAQIHNAHDDVLQIRLEGPRLLAQYNDGAKQIDLDPHYTLGTRYTLTITAANRRVQVSYNGATKVDLSLSGSEWYFKAGAYVQSNTSTGDQPPANAQVVIYALTATHSDQPSTASASTAPSAPAKHSDPKHSDPTPSHAAGESGVRTVSPPCTIHAVGNDVPAAQPGDTVCFIGERPDRLELDRGGTADAPVTYSGNNSATVPGVTIRADNVVVEGFIATHADSTGIWASGNNVILRDNNISAISRVGDDVDAIRFFGDHITISHNWAHDVWANPDAGGQPHVDCCKLSPTANPPAPMCLSKPTNARAATCTNASWPKTAPQE